MPFTNCWYHIIWAIKERQPVITTSVERVLFTAIRSKCSELNVECRAVNGTPDHVHVAVRMPPSISISEFVRQIKGASSHALNNMTEFSINKFRWQESYGALTFGERNLEFVVDYIKNQKQHHVASTTDAYLERDTD